MEAVEQSTLQFPLFVKPATWVRQLECRKVLSSTDLDDAIASARKYDEWIIIEEFSPGREIEVAKFRKLVWWPFRNREKSFLEPISYDYADKYEDGATLHTCRAYWMQR